tara:strand:- start:890 stop:1156 length:267 start_codon:yes stop_codon:yes gene_type:complete
MKPRVRRSYLSMPAKEFKNPATGEWTRITNTRWCLKCKDGNITPYLELSDNLYQAMPLKSFQLSIEKKDVDTDAIKQQVKKFVEEVHG